MVSTLEALHLDRLSWIVHRWTGLTTAQDVSVDT
jgi:hypothetical protein